MALKGFVLSVYLLLVMEKYIEASWSSVIVMTTIISQGVVIFADSVEPKELFVCTRLAGCCAL